MCDPGHCVISALRTEWGLEPRLNMNHPPQLSHVLPTLLLAGVLAVPAARAADATLDRLVEMSLEELLQVEITSLSKKSQRLADVAAAVHVITREDIRRSGATSLPEVLRLAPGVDAARISDNRWSVSIRGFSGRWANKLLVLVDGRSLYTPLYSGVEWEQENIPLSLIERIEVIRGPAAATWGANAVSGVINIITLPAAATQGSELEVSAGSQEFRALTAWLGTAIDADTHLRVYGTGDEIGANDRAVGGAPSNTGAHRYRGGLRLDKLAGGTDYTLIGEAWRDWESSTNITGLPSPVAPFEMEVPYSTAIEGAFLLARREGRDGRGVTSSLQATLEHVGNSNTLGWSMQRNTLDLDYHEHRQFDAGPDLTWGLGYRVADDQMGAPTLTIAYAPLDRTLSTFSLYTQADTPLAEDRWLLSLGARLENHTYTGWAFQPNARLLWHVNEQSSAWASVSRAVRTPNRTERDASFLFMKTYAPGDPTNPFPGAGGNAVTASLFGSAGLDAETLDALELGWRSQITPRLSLDLAAFAHHYDQLRAAVFTGYTVLGPGLLMANTTLENALAAHLLGLEASLDWHPRDDWRLAAAYSQARLKVSDDDLDIVEDLEGSLPRHILSLRSSHDLSERLKLDFWLRRVGARHTTHVPERSIPAYTSLDMQLTWAPRKDLELSIVGQNLLDAAHQEYASDIFLTVPVVIERRGSIQARWRF